MIESFDGKTPKIAKSAYISDAAYIIGDVEIGEGSSVWPGAVVRADFGSIRIGNYTHVEDNCVLHTGTSITIGDRVTVGHSVVVHCQRIGNNVLVGSNATLLDEAEIGDFCIIGANSLVTRGQKIPDKSLMFGVPAEVKGQLSEEQIARLQNGGESYIRMAQEYKRQGLEQPR